jgi:hypothetical protein
MARAAVLMCVLVGVGCADNPYVIGRNADAGVDECAEAYAGSVVCSGFEDADAAVGWDSAEVSGGAIERSTDRTRHGAGALHATTAAAMSYAVLVKTFPPVRSGELYFRANVYVPAAVRTETINIFFVGAEPTPDPFHGVDFNLEGGVVQTFSPQSDPVRQMGTLTIPRDRWFCFRAQVVVSHDEGAVQVFVDDRLALDATSIDTLPADGVTQFRAGIDWSSEQATRFDIYIDDVVLDTAPVSCRLGSNDE